MELSKAEWGRRAAAFQHVERVQRTQGFLSAADLAEGFAIGGDRIRLVHGIRGIWKPPQMEGLLSIQTVVPKPGGKVWYEDQLKAHAQIFDGEQWVDYSFMGHNPDAPENQWLKDAYERKYPFLYFVGIAPARYQAMCPAFVIHWDATKLTARVAFGDPSSGAYAERPETAPERKYALRVVKARLHQASFREAVMTAYRGTCALSGLPERLLLDAAHIIQDGDSDFGHPVVSNGIPLTKMHHAAFDAHLIGIDADCRIHVAKRLLSQKDGPTLEALKQLNGQFLRSPKRPQDAPDKDRLAMRFALFKELA